MYYVRTQGGYKVPIYFYKGLSNNSFLKPLYSTPITFVDFKILSAPELKDLGGNCLIPNKDHHVSLFPRNGFVVKIQRGCTFSNKSES